MHVTMQLDVVLGLKHTYDIGLLCTDVWCLDDTLDMSASSS